MDIKTFDIVLLFILSLCLSLVIAINVLFVVDKKLNNLKINVPVCPTPIVNINGSNIDVSNVGISYKNKNDSNKIESFKASKNIIPLDSHNNFTYNILNKDGSVTKQQISLYQPKQYMTSVGIGTLNNNNQDNIEVDGDIDQIGTSLTTYAYGNESDPVPLGSQLFREYY